MLPADVYNQRSDTNTPGSFDSRANRSVPEGELDALLRRRMPYGDPTSGRRALDAPVRTSAVCAILLYGGTLGLITGLRPLHDAAF
jgi:hypothetical protein